jgi:hypothetical protein
MRTKLTLGVAALTALCVVSAAAPPVLAQVQPGPSDQPPAAPAAWADTLKFSGQIEAGITFNPDSPGDRRNFGHLFTDHANQPVLNQLLLTAQRPLDPKATGWDFGFKLQGMYGADARFTHFLGELDHTINDTNQIDVVEANVMIHVPGLCEGGTDLKIGQYPTPIGFEVIDASGNPLYSHSYIFNFGVPSKHTGAYATAHVTSVLDLWAGIDTGVNTSLGKPGDNNGAIAGMAGLGLNLMDGNLTILGLSHFGPENPRNAGETFNANSAFRYLNDVVVTWKINDKLTSVTELNYIYDDGFKAGGGGVAQYLTYAIDDNWSVTGRAEIWNDSKGFFVAKFRGNFDFVNAESGLPTSPGGVVGGGHATYTELTAGVTWKPPVPKAIEGFMVRPEVRWDHSDKKSFGVGTPNTVGKNNDQFTLAADFVLPF